MKKILILFALCIFAVSVLNATTIIVSKNGGGQFKKIQTAIDNSSAGDTVKVWPGVYEEQIFLTKDIVLMGSGYEETIITGSFDPTVTLSIGKLMWFRISSKSGSGVLISGGTLTNCVVADCPVYGIHCQTGSANVFNCVIANNNWGIVNRNTGTLYVVNCIARPNADYGFYDEGLMFLSYSNGSRTSGTNGNVGVINTDPDYIPGQGFRISSGSPCWDSGNPSMSDPDGTISDMGYFGGPDCPIYPVIHELTITPDGNNISIEAKGRANY